MTQLHRNTKFDFMAYVKTLETKLFIHNCTESIIIVLAMA